MSPMTMRRRGFAFTGGFTLIEIMIVMVIIAMLAALVGPRLISALGGSKVKATKIQIEALSNALDTFHLDTGRYPSVQEGLLVLVQNTQPTPIANWRGPYLKKNKIPTDEWGQAGEQQRVEILKALIRGAKVLILDEPTSVLTPQEATDLFKVLNRMKQGGEGVIIITHKLDEVMAVSDRITVLRKGRVVGTMNTSDTNKNDLATLMVGREVSQVRSSGVTQLGEGVLKLEQLNVSGDRGVNVVKNVNLEIFGGEVLGIAGVAGNGQRELVEAITGLRNVSSGSVKIGKNDLTNKDAKTVTNAGVAHIPEDRLHMGVVGNLSVTENLALRGFEQAPFANGELLDFAAMENFALESIKTFDISTPGAHTRTRLLSGGNIQKLIFARELAGNPKLIIASHPTYGLDAGATAQVQNVLLMRARAGAGVMLVSEDLEEVLALSDRIAVMFAGEIMGIVARDTATIEQLGLMMAGQRHQEARA